MFPIIHIVTIADFRVTAGTPFFSIYTNNVNIDKFHLNLIPSLLPFVTSPSTPPPFPRFLLVKIIDPRLLMTQSYHVKFVIIGFGLKRISKR